MANARLGWFSPLGVAAPIRVAAGRVGLRAHCFRFSARAASEWPLGEFVLLPSASEWPSAGWSSGSLLPLFGMHRFGVAAGRVRSFAFRFGNCPRRVGLRVHCFRFSARTASEWPLGEFVLPPSVLEIPLGGWPSGSLLPLFGTHRFGVALGELVLLPSVSAFATRRVGLRAHASGLPSAGWPSGSRLPLFGMRRSAPPHRRREGRRSTPTRHLFHFKTLIPTC